MICLLVLGTLGCGSDADKATAEDNKAKQCYQRGDREAIRLDSIYDLAYFGRAMIYQEQGHQEQVEADFSETIRLNSNAAKAYYCRGLVYREKEETEKAEADFKKARDLGFDP